MQAESPDIRDSQQDLADLQRAVSLLESPTLTARMADVVGTPLEFAVRKLPAGVTRRINGATEAALSKAASAALWSLEKTGQGGIDQTAQACCRGLRRGGRGVWLRRPVRRAAAVDHDHDARCGRRRPQRGLRPR
jgi:hypothetical protein